MTTTTANTTTSPTKAETVIAVTTVDKSRVRAVSTGVRRLVRRLEHERRKWARGSDSLVPTEQAWRAGVSEGFRLAQIAIRKGV